MNNTMKMKNRILAIYAALAAMPKKPNMAATIAMTRKITVHRSITIVLEGEKNVFKANLINRRQGMCHFLSKIPFKWIL
ncbi:MAG TPA: hypothetical protein VMV20_08625 [Chitinophagaceae bacterium]|nr:hypothetical protein [Chitinophagaceae bacterium]